MCDIYTRRSNPCLPAGPKRPPSKGSTQTLVPILKPRGSARLRLALLCFGAQLLLLSSPAGAVLQKLEFGSSGVAVANTQISVFDAQGKKITTDSWITDEKGALLFPFPSPGRYTFVSDRGILNGTVTIQEGGPATVVVPMKEAVHGSDASHSDGTVPEEIRNNPAALYEFFRGFTGSTLEYFDAWHALTDEEQRSVQKMEDQAGEDEDSRRLEELTPEDVGARGLVPGVPTVDQAHLAAFFHYLLEPGDKPATRERAEAILEYYLERIQADPLQLAIEREYLAQAQRVILDELERTVRLAELDAKSQRRRERQAATAATRAFAEQAGADGIWTKDEEEQYWRLHDIESALWQPTPEEEAEIAQQQAVRDRVFSEIMAGAYLMGGTSSDDKIQRKVNADTAQIIVNMQKFDLPLLGEVNTTFTGEMANHTVGDIYKQREVKLEAENVMVSASLYANSTDKSEEERRFARQIYWMAYHQKWTAEDAMIMDSALLLGGVGLDFGFLGLGSTFAKVGQRVSSGIRGLWGKLFGAGAKASSEASAAAARAAEAGQSLFDDVAERGAAKARELGVDAGEIENAVARATNPVQPTGQYPRLVKYLSVNDLWVLSRFDEIIAQALEAGVRQPVIDDIIARARQAGTIDAFTMTARNELAVAIVRQRHGELVVGLGDEAMGAFREFFGTLADDYAPVAIDMDALQSLSRNFQETGSLTGPSGNVSRAEWEVLEQVISLTDEGIGNLYYFDELEARLINVADESFLGAARDFVEQVGTEVGERRQVIDLGPADVDVLGETQSWAPGAAEALDETLPLPNPGGRGQGTSRATGFRNARTELMTGHDASGPSWGDSTVTWLEPYPVSPYPGGGWSTAPALEDTVTFVHGAGSTTLTPPLLTPTLTWSLLPYGGIGLVDDLCEPCPEFRAEGQAGVDSFTYWSDGRFFVYLQDGDSDAPGLGLHPDLAPHIARTIEIEDNTLLIVDLPVQTPPAKKEEWIDQSTNIYLTEDDPFRVKLASNDPYFRSKGTWGQDYDDQWAIKRVGFSGGTDSAWSLVDKKRSPVVVAVIDSGVDWHHPDLTDAVLWRNEDEIAGNGIDDDENGYVDDLIGWNFIANTNMPWDRDGHGTFVSGLIAARQNNKRGIAGINPHARIMVLKALDDFGNSRASYLTEAIVYAADNGARVINLSVGGKKPTKAEQLSIAYAHSKGAVIIVAAGNEGADLSGYAPAGLQHVVTVASTDTDDGRAPFSNWGGSVDVAAPGIDVLSLRARNSDLMWNVPGLKYKRGANCVGKDKNYFRASGTSFSAPIVAGVASLLFTQNPGLDNTQVERMLLHAAEDVEVPGWDQFTGYGLVNAGLALQADPDYYVEARISEVAAIRAGGQTMVRVHGTASADEFKRAVLELGTSTDPEEWKKVAILSDPVEHGVLGDIPAAELAGSSQWTIRIITRHKDGSQREARHSLTLQ